MSLYTSSCFYWVSPNTDLIGQGVLTGSKFILWQCMKYGSYRLWGYRDNIWSFSWLVLCGRNTPLAGVFPAKRAIKAALPTCLYYHRLGKRVEWQVWWNTLMWIWRYCSMFIKIFTQRTLSNIAVVLSSLSVFSKGIPFPFTNMDQF